ncbi:MAG: YkgJ family cysteine cluster protein [Betaproteobacteria bacterium]|nr:YkgJ family cysteine cluster protein [Betaproteobacteria bacterium]
MSARRSLATELAAAAAAYQTADVIPHCTQCAKPCCKLDALVLEMEWKQIKTLWKVSDSRAVFDKQLAAGEGPQEIRESEGLYFVHSKPCPAYDQAGGSCQIYGQALKPVGCSDFPVYEDRGSIMADLRCEAVDLKALTAWIARTLGPEVRIVQSADREFPFLVTLSVRSSGNRRK